MLHTTPPTSGESQKGPVEGVLPTEQISHNEKMIIDTEEPGQGNGQCCSKWHLNQPANKGSNGNKWEKPEELQPQSGTEEQ
jgi:hypothetical protein